MITKEKEMKVYLKRFLKWFHRKDLEVVRQGFLIVQPPTNEDDPVILLHGVDFREEHLR